MASSRTRTWLLVVAIVASSLALSNSADEKEAAGLTYRKHGLDWPGLCQTGKKQSPINISTKDLKALDRKFAPNIDTLGRVKNTVMFLTPALPHVELMWDDVVTPTNATVAADKDGNIFAPLKGEADLRDHKRVEFQPAQFHFHTPSESGLDGKLFDGVIHIVNFVKPGESKYCDGIKAAGGLGCPIVLSIFLEGGTTQTSALNAVFTSHVKSTGDLRSGDTLHGGFSSSDYVIKSTGKENGIKSSDVLNLDYLLPKNGEVAMWEGSLTTAPCTEGVLWIKYLTPLSVSHRQIYHLRNTLIHAVGGDCRSTRNGRCFPPRHFSNNRIIQPLNGRIVRKTTVNKHQQ